jgi:hypothetical protein
MTFGKPAALACDNRSESSSEQALRFVLSFVVSSGNDARATRAIKLPL